MSPGPGIEPGTHWWEDFVDISALLLEIGRSLSDVCSNDVVVCEFTFCAVVGFTVFVSRVGIYPGDPKKIPVTVCGFSLRL